MNASTTRPVGSTSTAIHNITITTKSTEQILIQSSGAMIAIIVIGIIIILAIVLVILKTYNRRTHAARVLKGGSSKPRKNTSSTTHTVPMANARANNGLGSIAHSSAPSENGFRFPQVDLGTTPSEQLSTNSGSTVVTVHDTPSVENT